MRHSVKLALVAACAAFSLDLAAKGPANYSVVILGDTHFDADPPSVYHSHYDPAKDYNTKVHQAEFVRNAKMWRETCPRLVDRAVRLVDKKTQVILQVGDLIQGDCGQKEAQIIMMEDAMNMFKGKFGGLPFITTSGNHDMRGVGGRDAYFEYMPKRMSQELRTEITKLNYYFWIGEDAYIVIDFNNPVEEEITECLKATEGARYTFVLTHAPLLVSEDSSCTWYLLGKGKENEEYRYRLRRQLAERNVICIAGHTHYTELLDWVPTKERDGYDGRITQLVCSSVWASESDGIYSTYATEASQFGKHWEAAKYFKPQYKYLFDELRDGVQKYMLSNTAGSYKLTVTKKHVRFDYYCGDSEKPSFSEVIR